MRPTEGHCTTLVSMPSLAVHMGHCGKVSAYTTFVINVTYYYENAISATEYGPGCEEYVELQDVRLLTPLYLTNNAGISMSIDSKANFLDILHDGQVDVIINRIKLNNSEDNLLIVEEL